MSTFVAGIEIKTSTKHVEAASDVVSGRGFNSPRLQFCEAKLEQEIGDQGSRRTKKALADEYLPINRTLSPAFTCSTVTCSSFFAVAAHLLILKMAFLFENLDVYQKSLDFSERVMTLTETFPRGYYFLVDQLNRASLAVATNLAEGNGRFTKADRKNFFVISRASAQECVPLLELARRKGFVQDATHADLRERIEVIAKMISGLINGMDKRQT